MQRISVWLDDTALKCGAFAHGLEWAARLGLPLQIVSSPRRWWVKREPDDGQAAEAIAGTLAACGVACARQGVCWEAAAWDGPVAAGIATFFRPADLWVFGTELPIPVKEEFLHQAAQAPAVPLLVCPHSWQSATRMLILHEYHEPANDFLACALRLCATWRIAPVVLTVGRSERAARRGQDFAEETAAAQRCHADFDSLVGADLQAATAHIAQWRRRTHVIVERRCATPWQRWLGDSVVELLGLSESLTFLALPGRLIGSPTLAAASCS